MPDIILLNELSDMISELNSSLGSDIDTINSNVSAVKTTVDAINTATAVNNTASTTGTLSQKLSSIISTLSTVSSNVTTLKNKSFCKVTGGTMTVKDGYTLGVSGAWIACKYKTTSVMVGYNTIAVSTYGNSVGDKWYYVSFSNN